MEVMETSHPTPALSSPPELPHTSPADETKQTESAKILIKSYLRQHLEVYRDLCEVRDAGHDNEECEAYFKNQRTRADHADEKTQKGFFGLMVTIGHELDATTSALTIRRHGMPRPAILDLCMAPGGFSLAALQRNGKSAVVRGISLPPAQGGHEIRLRDVSSRDGIDARILVDYRDITLLREEMDVPLRDIPTSYPDAALFSSDRPYFGRQFDLVFCDGQVLRTHERGEHRAEHEGVRLLTSQLVLALQRIRPGGTMVVLLHRADAWSSVRMIYSFSLFSDSVELFKPLKGHRMRSSFYLVAKGVDPGRDAAVQALERWKVQWKIATFGTESMKESEWGILGRTEEMEAKVVIDKFGSELLRLAEPVFTVQAKALKNAPWMKKANRKTDGEKVLQDEALVVESTTV